MSERNELAVRLTEFGIAMRHGESERCKVLYDVILSMFDAAQPAAPAVVEPTYEQLRAALKDAITRMNRARDILTDGKPSPECNWGLLATEELTATLHATPPEGPQP